MVAQHALVAMEHAACYSRALSANTHTHSLSPTYIPSCHCLYRTESTSVFMWPCHAIKLILHHLIYSCRDWDVAEVTRQVLEAKEGIYKRLTQETGINPFPGAEPLIRQAQSLGMPLGVGSSGAPEKIRHNLEGSGLAGLIPEHLIVSASHVARVGGVARRCIPVPVCWCGEMLAIDLWGGEEAYCGRIKC